MVFGPEANPDKVDIIWLQDTNLIQLSYGVAGEHSITLHDWHNPEKRIEELRFSDGTIWASMGVPTRMSTGSDDVYKRLGE